MPTEIIKPERDVDFYVAFSWIVEAPTAFGPREWMSGFVFRRRVKLDDNTTANVSKTGASISHRRGRVTVNSRRGVSVRIFRGLSWRSKW